MADHENTPTSTLVPWASQHTVERYHTEYKAHFAEQTRELDALDKRLSEAEFTLKAIGERLNTGAATFTRQEDRLKKVEDGRNPKWSTVAAIGMVVAGWIWVFSRYPDPQQFQTLKEKVEVMQLNGVELKRDIGEIQKQQNSIDAKLDKVLSRP